ncbi:MAG: NADH:flavin oxidoreductase [Treponema sp.]|jgi:2,4-dienoyl-CoA reductase-like NADH-dependent reductase (Old Yellow Enzyme family)|nr:NADH:flavin oxidoreductase [Treponema sp.]
MSILFEPLTIKNKTMPNRFFAQAMEGNDGENGGRPSERTMNRYIELAKGRWGAVQVEAVSVLESSLARINGMIINKKNLDSFKRLVEAFKKHNDTSPLFLQITHSGERSGLFSEKVTLTPEDRGRLPNGSQNTDCRLLSSDEIEKIKELFIEGAALAEEAGMDGIDLKMCHGYFGAEMLRPSNTRDDQWGGSFENRTRFLREAVGGIKSSLHTRDFVLGSRLSMYEGVRGGCGTSGPDEVIEDIAGMLELVRVMNGLGMDFVNVSAGIPAQTGHITRPVEQSKHLALHHLRYTKAVKDLVKNEKLSLKVIGSAYSAYKEESLTVMEETLSKDYVDACGFGRQIFADPLTPKKIAAGEKVNWCMLCSGCSKLMKAQLNDGCIMYDAYYKEVNKNCKTPK